MQGADLRSLFLFDGVSDEALDLLAAAGEEVAFSEGEVLFRQGEPAESWWVLLEGRVELRRRAGHDESIVGAMERPGVWAGGFLAWSGEAGYMGTGRAASSGRMFCVPPPTSVNGRAPSSHWAHTSSKACSRRCDTSRASRASAKHSSRWARSRRDSPTRSTTPRRRRRGPSTHCRRRATTSSRRSCNLAEGSFRADAFVRLDALRREISGNTTSDALRVADREDELTTWLEDRGVREAWRVAPALAAADADVAWCERAAGTLDEDTLEPGLRWIADTLGSSALLAEMRESTGADPALVAAVKSYTQLDRASIQSVDVTEGLESTLVMLGHKLGHQVSVIRHYDADLPQIEANAGELNQVWTNLIDNAIDAMDGPERCR